MFSDVLKKKILPLLFFPDSKKTVPPDSHQHLNEFLTNLSSNNVTVSYDCSGHGDSCNSDSKHISFLNATSVIPMACRFLFDFSTNYKK